MKKHDSGFIAKLNELRGRESISSFAKHCGIKQQTMNNYINGITEPSLSALRKIAQVNNIQVGELVGEESGAGGGHTAIGGSGVMQAGGDIKSSSITQDNQELQLNQTERMLIDKLRLVGSPLLIQKIMDQLQQLENFVKGK